MYNDLKEEKLKLDDPKIYALELLNDLERKLFDEWIDFDLDSEYEKLESDRGIQDLLDKWKFESIFAGIKRKMVSITDIWDRRKAKGFIDAIRDNWFRITR